jgi:hypothetical protein
MQCFKRSRGLDIFFSPRYSLTGNEELGLMGKNKGAAQIELPLTKWREVVN